jgi:hypothetical protein
MCLYDTLGHQELKIVGNLFSKGEIFMLTTAPLRFGRIQVSSLNYFNDLVFKTKTKADITVQLTGKKDQQLAPVQGVNKFTLQLDQADQLVMRYQTKESKKDGSFVKVSVEKSAAVRLFQALGKTMNVGELPELERIEKDEKDKPSYYSQGRQALTQVFPKVKFFNPNSDDCFDGSYPALQAFDKALGANLFPQAKK